MIALPRPRPRRPASRRPPAHRPPSPPAAAPHPFARAVPVTTPVGRSPRWRGWRPWLILAAISVGWKVLVLTVGAALPQWVVGDGIDHLPPALRPYAEQAKGTAIALWSGPLERRGLVRAVRVVSVDSNALGDSAARCNGLQAQVRAYTYFAIPYSEVRTVCDAGVVVYRVFRRRTRAD